MTSTLLVVTDMDAPVEVCFDLSMSIDLDLESMLASDEHGRRLPVVLYLVKISFRDQARRRRGG